MYGAKEKLRMMGFNKKKRKNYIFKYWLTKQSQDEPQNFDPQLEIVFKVNRVCFF